jgi:hypothetical protein
MSDGTRGETESAPRRGQDHEVPDKGVLYDFARSDDDFRRV